MDLASFVRQAVSSGSALAFPLALLGGVISGLNPCCVPIYPAAAATCTANRGTTAARTLTASFAFVLGMAVATTVLGGVAALAGRAMTGVSGAGYFVAVIPLLMGLHVLGWLHLPMPNWTGGRRNAGGIGGTFVAGLLLSVVIAPCGTPVLASVLSFAAYSRSLVFGGTLLFLYGLGAGLPVVVVGTAAGRLGVFADSAGWTKWVDRLTGAMLLAVGFFLLWRA